MDKDAIMQYAFNIEAKYADTAYMVRTIDNNGKYEDVYSCNYPIIGFQQTEQQIIQTIASQSVEESRLKTKRTQQLFEMMEEKAFTPLTEKEILNIENVSLKLSRSSRRKLNRNKTASDLQNTPIIYGNFQNNLPRVNLSSSMKITAFK